MGRKTNPNSIDPTEYPLEKVPQVVADDDPPELDSEDSPVEDGIIEEQQGDLEGLDGNNSIVDPDPDDDLEEDTGLDLDQA